MGEILARAVQAGRAHDMVCIAKVMGVIVLIEVWYWSSDKGEFSHGLNTD